MSDESRLKLRAEDIDDLEVLGAMAQDALVPLGDMTWLRDQGRFVLVLNRFMWERVGEVMPESESEAPAPVYFRVHGALSINNVQSVQVRDLDQTNREQLLNVLAITGGPDHVQLEFAGGGTIRVQVDGLQCLLEDLGEPWPTRWRPTHDTEDEPEEPAGPATSS